MTDTTPDGVAGQIINDVNQHVPLVWEKRWNTDPVFRHAMRWAMDHLQRELSREARTILSELYDAEEQALADDMPGGVAVAEGDRLTLIPVFQRLGLDIESREK